MLNAKQVQNIFSSSRYTHACVCRHGRPDPSSAQVELGDNGKVAIVTCFQCGRMMYFHVPILEQIADEKKIAL